MSVIGTLIENVMSAGVMNTVPITICSFQAAEKQVEAAKKFILTVELQNGTGQFFEIGRTGSISAENDRAEINKTLQVPYKFTELQRVKFIVCEAVEEGGDSKEVGCDSWTLGQIVSLREITVKLSNEIGTLEVKTEKIADSRSITFDVCAEKLEKKDLFGKSDPFLQISRKEDNGAWTVVHKTEHIKDTLNPRWKEFSLSYHLLCGNDLERDVKFACYDFDRSGNCELLGEVFFAPSQILKNNAPQSFALTNAKKKLKKKGFGRLTVKKCKVKKEPSFIGYILAGCRFRLTCGIDFTGSNGDPQKNSSLHYMGSANPNKYVLSMRAVGRILQEYISDKQINAYGFGAKIPPDYQVSHDFTLGEGDNNTYSGMDEVLRAYESTLNAVKLWGPTHFAPIINKVADAAEASNGGKLDYHILFMLTDGVVTDMDDMKRAVVRASKLPISIVVVGIGNADFGGMDILNKEPKFIKSPEGETAARRILKYVSFRDFNFSSMDTLARNLLEEIPVQITEYYTINEIDFQAEDDKKVAPETCKPDAISDDISQCSDEKPVESPEVANTETAVPEFENQASHIGAEETTRQDDMATEGTQEISVF